MSNYAFFALHGAMEWASFDELKAWVKAKNNSQCYAVLRKLVKDGLLERKKHNSKLWWKATGEGVSEYSKIKTELSRIF